MAFQHQHIRSSQKGRRPIANDLIPGQLAVNFNDETPGIFFESETGQIIKSGPTHVGTTPPPLVKQSEYSPGELWFDLQEGIIKIWTGNGWRATSFPVDADLKGEPGIKGEKGQKGERGYEGQNGRDGDDGDPGEDGKSAYESAQDAGFSGTEGQWVASLKGEAGEPGEDGESAYQSAVDQGFQGTEGQWVESLKGEAGGDGDDGKSAYESAVDTGFQGTEGQWVDSLKGDAGDNGTDGESAYDTWKGLGNTGTEQDFVDSLKGEPGANGADGDSAYDSAVNGGFVGTEGQWVASLKGDQGDAGADGTSVTLQGAVADLTELNAVTGQSQGDLYVVADDGSGDANVAYVWDGSAWQAVGPITGPKGEQGETGESAYDSAVAGGFQGTEAEWVESLKGDAGDNGTDGDSAYEIAQNAGFTGTEAEWLESLKGDQGDQGLQGDSAYEVAQGSGFQGTEGEWVASLKGDTGDAGTDGDSAYDSAVAGGFQGTEAEWVASLKGDAGAAGSSGTDGDSAYDTAVSGGFQGTEAEWIASLKGDAGDDGASAYDLAVKGGYPSSETVWLESLKGDQGDAGAGGSDGISAYDSAVKGGFQGTEDQWVASLKGEEGDEGPVGADGESAYDSAVKGGFSGTEEQWVASLKGEAGDPFDSDKYVEKSGDEMTGTLTVKNAIRDTVGDITIDTNGDLKVGQSVELPGQPYRFKLGATSFATYTAAGIGPTSGVHLFYNDSTLVHNITANGGGWFRGGLKTGGDGTSAQARFQATDDGQVNLRHFLNIEKAGGGVNTLQFKAGDGLFIGDSSVTGETDLQVKNTIALNLDGSASFAGNVGVGTTSPGATFHTKIAASQSNIAQFESGGGTLVVRTQSAGGGEAVLNAFQGNSSTTAVPIVFQQAGNEIARFNADGSATFAGGVNVGSSANRIGVNWGYQVYGSKHANGFALYNEGIHDGPSAPYFLRCNVTGVSPSPDTVVVRTDGSATFAGSISTGGAEAGAMLATGARMRGTGDISIRKDGGVASVFEVFKDGSTSTHQTCSINSNGSATFAGGNALFSSGGSLLLDAGGDPSTSAKVNLNSSGNITIVGTVEANAGFTQNGNPVVFAGDNLVIDAGTSDEIDVRERLTAAQETFQELRTAVDNVIALKADIADPTFTGVVKAGDMRIQDGGQYSQIVFAQRTGTSIEDGLAWVDIAGGAQEAKIVRDDSSEELRFYSAGNVTPNFILNPDATAEFSDAVSISGALTLGGTEITATATELNLVGDLGTFTGDIIADNSDLKTALQAVETAIEDVEGLVVVEVLNDTGSDISIGTPVYVSGTHVSGKPTIALADSDGASTYPALGLTQTAIVDGAEGNVVISGLLEGLDTDTPAWDDGTPLYVSSVAGGLTSTRPTAATEKVQKVALVTRRHASAGSVVVMGAGRTNDVPNELVALTGVALNDSDLGTFSGTTIADNESIKGALQDVETAVETKLDSNAATVRTLLGIGEYVDDAAAGTGGVASGAMYYNTTTSDYRLKS